MCTAHVHAWIRYLNEEARLERQANSRAGQDNQTIASMGFGDRRIRPRKVKGKEERNLILKSNLVLNKKRVAQPRTAGCSEKKGTEMLENAVLQWNSRYVDHSTVSHTKLLPIMDFSLVRAEAYIAEAKAMRKKRIPPWEVEEFLFSKIARAHQMLLSCNTRTEAGLYQANRYADAIDLLVQYIDENDREAQLITQALTYSCSPRMKRNEDGEETRQPVRIPDQRSRDGKRVLSWKTILKVDPRLDMVTEFDHGQKESYVAISVPVMDKYGNRKKGTSFTSIRKIQAAELGLDNEYQPVYEPSMVSGRQLSEIRRRPGENSIELRNDGEACFNPVQEEYVMRNHTYSPEREEEWLEILREGLEYVSSLNEIVALYDGVQLLWKSKAFRFHIYREIHNEVVQRAWSIEAIKDHEKISDWKLVGADASKPNHGENLIERLDLLNKELETAQLSGNEKIIRRIKNQRRSAYKALHRFWRKAERSALFAWNNFLSKEGMGVRRNGEPFGDDYDGVTDALMIKGARATGGTPKELDCLLYGSQEDESKPGETGTKHSVAVDEINFADEIQEVYGIGPQTIKLFEEAGYKTLDEVDQLSLDELIEITGHQKRAVTIWYMGARIIQDDEAGQQDLMEMAVSRFGSSRGASVDLLKPWKKDRHALACLNTQEPRELSQGYRVPVEDYSMTEIEKAALEQGLDYLLVPVHKDNYPVAFDSKEELLALVLKNQF